MLFGAVVLTAVAGREAVSEAAFEAASETASDLPFLIADYCCDTQNSNVEDGVTEVTGQGHLCVDTTNLRYHDLYESPPQGKKIRMHDGTTSWLLTCSEPPCEPTTAKGWRCQSMRGKPLNPLADPPFRFTAPLASLVAEFKMNITLNQSTERHDDFSAPVMSKGAGFYMHWHVAPAVPGRVARRLLATVAVQPKLGKPSKVQHGMRAFSNCSPYTERVLPEGLECDAHRSPPQVKRHTGSTPSHSTATPVLESSQAHERAGTHEGEEAAKEEL